MKYVGEEIYNVIPNRFPYMILDSLDVEENKAISEVHLKEDLWIFACHFPGRPTLPMTLLVECMTQTFMATLYSKKDDKSEISLVYYIGEMHLKEGAQPGDLLRIEADLKSFKRGIAKGVCRAYRNGGDEPILEFEIAHALPSQMIKMR